MKKKNWILFIGGVLTGVVLMFLVSVAIALKQNKIEGGPDIKLFDEPGNVIESSSFRVIQVITEGAALATTEDEDGDYIFGLTCLLTSDKGKYYYDHEIVKVPDGKVARQVGVFQYESRGGSAKTVPVVKFMDK